jgi:acetyltransferase EpsM
MKDLVAIWGAGGHALVVADIVSSLGRFSIAGFLDEIAPERAGESFATARVVGGLEALPKLVNMGVKHFLPGVGNPGSRLRMLPTLERHGVSLANACHPSSIVAKDVTLGAGTVLCAGAIVCTGAKVGNVVILNTACSVDHHCSIGDGAHIGPGARLAGGVQVESGAWIGIGAIVREGVTIGMNAIVGAGAVVLHDVPPGDVVVGNPARFLKRNPSATHSS